MTRGRPSDTWTSSPTLEKKNSQFGSGLSFNKMTQTCLSHLSFFIHIYKGSRSRPRRVCQSGTRRGAQAGGRVEAVAWNLSHMVSLTSSRRHRLGSDFSLSQLCQTFKTTLLLSELPMYRHHDLAESANRAHAKAHGLAAAWTLCRESRAMLHVLRASGATPVHGIKNPSKTRASPSCACAFSWRLHRPYGLVSS